MNLKLLLYLLMYCNISVLSQNNETALQNKYIDIKNESVERFVDSGVVLCNGCIDIFIDYMLMKDINQVVVFSCGSNNDIIKYNRKLTKAGILSVFLRNKNVNINKIKRIFPERELKGVFVNYDCSNSKDLFQVASQLALFDEVRLWTIFTESVASTVTDLRTYNLNLNTNLVMMIKGTNDQWVAYDIFNIGFEKGAPLNITLYGVYNSKTSVTYNYNTKPILLHSKQNYSFDDIDEMFALKGTSLDGGDSRYGKWRLLLDENWIRRRWSMQYSVTLSGAYCTVDKRTTGTYESYIYSSDDVHRDTFTRMYFAMMHHIIDMMQFNIKLIHTKTWGAYENGSWTGVLGALTQEMADMSLSPMALKKERVGAGDVNAFACYAKFPVIFRQPQSSAASLALFVYPLETKCWLVALPIAVVAVIAAMGIMVIESKYLGQNAENSDVTISNFIMSMVCVLYQDGPEKSPRLWSGRALLFVMLMFGYMMTQFYSASLIGSILMEPPKRINNVKDLIRSNLHFRAEAVAYQWMFFKEHMSFTEVNELYNKKLMKPGKWPAYMDVDDGLRMIRKGGFAFQVYGKLMERVMDVKEAREVCQTNAAYAYKEMREWGDDIICEVDELLVYPLTRLYARVRRGSPYRQHITTAMLLQYERGVQSYIIERWFIKRPRCPPEHASRPRPVAEQFYPALELLAAFGGLSIIIVIIENIAARVAKERKRLTFRE